MAFATPRISSHNALKDAVPALWHLLRLFVSPLQRAGTCEAHPPPPEGMPSVPDSRYKLPNLALIAFLSLKSLALKAYLKVRLGIQA